MASRKQDLIRMMSIFLIQSSVPESEIKEEVKRWKRMKTEKLEIICDGLFTV